MALGGLLLFVCDLSRRIVWRPTQARTSTDPEDVRNIVFQLKEKIRQDEQEVDRIFLIRQAKERQIK